MITATTFKQEAHKLVDQLPENGTWRDLIYRAAVREDIEAGLADSDANRVKPVEELLKEFGIEE
jgi:predicted transcriptional regulator